MKFFYTLGVSLYTAAVHIASLWSPKARKWVKGRKEVWQKIEEFKPKQFVYWFHCASLGEFEQGRPLIERLKKEQQCQIVITFFSPSGFEIRKNYELADLVIYLPKDSKKNAIQFFNKIQPKAVFFIKYEFWANYILEANKRQIPIYSIAALFRRDQVFFTPYGKYMRKVLAVFTQIFVQNEHSKALLAEIQIDAVVCGDTRFDRVVENSMKVQKYERIQAAFAHRKVLVCGSIWPEDLRIIATTLKMSKDYTLIIAPHEISESFLQTIEDTVERKSIRYSMIQSAGIDPEVEVLLIDNIGMLMNLYQYGDIAYVGGGFKTGLHNILEPAAFGLPVIFGSEHEKFPEAQLFIDNGVGFEVNDSLSFALCLQDLKEHQLKEKVKQFMQSQTGATDTIMREITGTIEEE